MLLLIPVFDDWEALTLLLGRLDEVAADEEAQFAVLVVDDASTTELTSQLAGLAPRALTSIAVLPLRRNLGHQRAIAVGLAYAEAHLDHDAVVVMDADGEDDPRDVPRLLARLSTNGARRIVFAERTRRSESLTFRLLYHCYRLGHLLLTGLAVRVGNFSAVPRSALTRLIVVSELWNHYAAAVFASRLPYESIPTSRGRRLAGSSRMNLVALMTHGLRALSVHGELVGTRLLIAALLVATVSGFALMGLVGTLLVPGRAAPGWIPEAAVALLFVIAQTGVLAFFAAIVTLRGRSQAAFLPARDYGHFVLPVHTLFTRSAS